MASTLDGITVLDLSTGAPAALATMFLSDHGARVIRVVHPNDKKMRTGGFIAVSYTHLTLPTILRV